MKRVLETKFLMKKVIQMKKITLKTSLKITEVFTDLKDIVFKK